MRQAFLIRTTCHRDRGAQKSGVRQYFVYMLACADGSFYVGVTNNAERRVWEHNAGVDEACYTFTRRPVRIVHCSGFRCVDDAIACEKRLKGWSRAKKAALARDDWAAIHEIVTAARSRRSFDCGASRLRSG